MRQDTQTFNLRLTPDLVRWVKEQAARNRRSMNSEIACALDARRECLSAREAGRQAGGQTAGMASQA